MNVSDGSLLSGEDDDCSCTSVNDSGTLIIERNWIVNLGENEQLKHVQRKACSSCLASLP